MQQLLQEAYYSGVCPLMNPDSAAVDDKSAALEAELRTAAWGRTLPPGGLNPGATKDMQLTHFSLFGTTTDAVIMQQDVDSAIPLVPSVLAMLCQRVPGCQAQRDAAAVRATDKFRRLFHALSSKPLQVVEAPPRGPVITCIAALGEIPGLSQSVSGQLYVIVIVNMNAEDSGAAGEHVSLMYAQRSHTMPERARVLRVWNMLTSVLALGTGASHRLRPCACAPHAISQGARHDFVSWGRVGQCTAANSVSPRLDPLQQPRRESGGLCPGPTRHKQGA